MCEILILQRKGVTRLRKFVYHSNSPENTKQLANEHFQIYLCKFNIEKDEVENKHYIQWIRSKISEFRKMENLSDNTSLYRENADSFIKYLNT